MINWRQVPITILVIMTGCYVGPTRSGAFPEWIVDRDMESLYVDVEYGIGIADSRPEALYNAFLNLLHRETGYYVTLPYPGCTATIGTISVNLGPLYITESGTIGEDTLYSVKGLLIYAPSSQDEPMESLYDSFIERQSGNKIQEYNTEGRNPYFKIERQIMVFRQEGGRTDQPRVLEEISVGRGEMTFEMFLNFLKEDKGITIEDYYGPVPGLPVEYSYHGVRVIVAQSLIRLHPDKRMEELSEEVKKTIERNAIFEEFLKRLDTESESKDGAKPNE